MQFINRYIQDHRKKVYSISYISNLSFQLIHSEFILKKHTIQPHIEATERIIGGDEDLLVTTLESDEFDILTAKAMKNTHLPQEYKLLIGYDNIDLIQMYEYINYLSENEYTRETLNKFVSGNLKLVEEFLNRPIDDQKDILNTYWDYLFTLNHESNRMIFFIYYMFAPLLTEYINSKQFILFPTKSAVDNLNKIKSVCKEFKDLIPDENYLEKVKNGGIQGVL